MKKHWLVLASLFLGVGSLAVAGNRSANSTTSKTPVQSGTKTTAKAPATSRTSGTNGTSGTKEGAVWNLNLQEAVSLALRQNPDVLRARQEIERTKGLVIEVRAQALPQATVTSNYTQQDVNLLRDFGGTSQNGQSSSSSAAAKSGTAQKTQSQQQSQQQSQSFQTNIQDKSWNVTVTGRQLLYSGGAVGAALKIANLTVDSSYFSLRESIDMVIFRTRTFFNQVLVNRELIKVQEESVRLLKDQLKDQQIRFEAGTVPRFNVLQAEVAVSNAIPALIQARNDYLISQLNLAKVLGVDYGGADQPVPFHVVGNLSINEKAMSLDEAIDTARAQRAILKVQRQQMLIQVQQIQVALSGYKPTLSVQGGYQVRNSRASSSLADTVNGWFFGVTGSWNLFDGFETYGKAKQARAQLEQARVSYNDTWHTVELEVQSAYANLQRSKELMQSQEKNVEQAEEAVRLATERLAAGAGTQLDVLSQTVALTTAMTTRLQARSSYILAIAELERASGAITRYEETFDDPVVIKMRAKLSADTAAHPYSTPVPVPVVPVPVAAPGAATVVPAPAPADK